jgi:hypothetical protein
MEEKSSSNVVMRRWRVCRAYDGAMFEFDLRRSDDANVFQRTIFKRLGIKEQIILYGPPYKRLLNTKPLRRAVGKDIFVFDRRHLSRTNPPRIEPIVLTPRHIVFPLSGEKKNIKGTQATIMRVLHDYSQQFEHSLDTARAFLTANSQRLRSCCSSLKQQDMIRRAWEAASTNLQEHCDTSIRKFREFNRAYREEHESQIEILESFDKDLERLCEVRLHREIRGIGKLTLIDSVPVSRLKEWASECTKSQKCLEFKVAELSEVYFATLNGVRRLNVPLRLIEEDEEEEDEGEETTTWSVSEFRQDERQDDSSTRSSGNREDQMRRSVESLRSLLETLRTRVIDTLESDVSKIREMIKNDTTASRQEEEEDEHSVREIVRDMCKKLETTHRFHQDELLPQLHAMDKSVMCTMDLCAQNHTSLMEKMRNKMYLVSVLQSVRCYVSLSLSPSIQ